MGVLPSHSTHKALKKLAGALRGRVWDLGFSRASIGVF